MSNRLVLAIALMFVAATVACGTSGSILPPHPEGNYSNASLNGSYVYEIHGFDASNGNPYRQVGVFVADGKGNITGGSDDSSFAAAGAQVTGTYQIARDGTGFITGLNTTLGVIDFAVTLVSSSKLQLIEADSFANASGTAEFQPPSAMAAAFSGTYIFRLHQEISAQAGSPAAEVGAIAISGGVAAGSMDENLAGVFSSPNITATLTAPAGFGRGTGTLVNSSTNFTTNLVYYIVDINRVVLLVSNVGAVGSGTAELQSGTVSNGLSGSYAFGSRGDDSSLFGGIATVGQFNAASGIMTGTEDINQDGNTTLNASLSSCYTASASGRVVVSTLSGSTCSSTAAQVFWMVSPSRAFFVNASLSFVEDGSADLQQAQNFSASTFTQQYSLAMDGWDTGTIDGIQQLLSRVGTLQFNGTGKLTLNEVANSSAFGFGGGQVLAGSYSVASNGRIVGTLNGSTFQNIVMYAVSPSQAYVLQTDPSLVTSGMLQHQQ